MPIRDVGEIEHAIEVFARAGNGGLMVLPDVSSTNYRDLIIAARKSSPGSPVSPPATCCRW